MYIYVCYCLFISFCYAILSYCLLILFSYAICHMPYSLTVLLSYCLLILFYLHIHTHTGGHTTHMIHSSESEDLASLSALLISMFQEADDDGNGSLTFDEFQNLMEQVDLGITPQELRFVISEADENDNGVVVSVILFFIFFTFFIFIFIFIYFLYYILHIFFFNYLFIYSLSDYIVKGLRGVRAPSGGPHPVLPRS
jgi:hypothetical protein